MNDTNQTQEYRLREGMPGHYRDDGRVNPGETFVPSERELELYSEKFVPVGSGGDAQTDAHPEDDDDLTDLPNVGAATADNLRDAGYGTFDAIRDADAATIADDVRTLSESDTEEMQAHLADDANTDGGG